MDCCPYSIGNVQLVEAFYSRVKTLKNKIVSPSKLVFPFLPSLSNLIVGVNTMLQIASFHVSIYFLSISVVSRYCLAIDLHINYLMHLFSLIAAVAQTPELRHLYFVN